MPSSPPAPPLAMKVVKPPAQRAQPTAWTRESRESTAERSVWLAPQPQQLERRMPRKCRCGDAASAAADATANDAAIAAALAGLIAGSCLTASSSCLLRVLCFLVSLGHIIAPALSCTLPGDDAVDLLAACYAAGDPVEARWQRRQNWWVAIHQHSST